MTEKWVTAFTTFAESVTDLESANNRTSALVGANMLDVLVFPVIRHPQHPNRLTSQSVMN